MSDVMFLPKRLRPSAAARYLGLSTPTLKRYARDGKIAFYQFNEEMTFDLVELERVRAQHYVPAQKAA